MHEKTRVDVLHSTNLYGSERYTLTVEITNLSDKSLLDVQARPLLIPGKTLSFKEDPSYSEISKYEYESQVILSELNLQIIEAYCLLKETQKSKENTIHDSLSSDSSLAYPKASRIKVSTPLFSSKLGITPSDAKSLLKRILTTEISVDSISSVFFEWETLGTREMFRFKERIPIWAQEATKISNWQDIERAEKLFIDKLPEESFLKQSFLADKDKLKSLNEQTESHLFNNSGKNFELKPGQSVSFTFYCKAPGLLHERRYDSQFEVYYLEPGSNNQGDIVGVQTVRKILSFQSSSHAIPLGTFLGGISGFLVRQIFLSPDFIKDLTSNILSGFLSPLLGTILLSWILAIVVRRSEDSKKFITIEDFSGGFFVGSIAGLFSQEILDYLRVLLPTK